LGTSSENNKLSSLAQLIDNYQDEITSYINLGKVKWEKLISTIRSQEKVQNPTFADEQIWTFLMACGYALSGEAGLRELSKILTGSDVPLPPKPKIWLEALPLPPRRKEGNTNVDMAIGTISQRDNTKSGIRLENTGNTWICFCEMKFNSDIAQKTTHEANRNQLLRVIENALCFQNAGQYSDKIYVTLVTPEKYHDRNTIKSYREQFENYQIHPDKLKHELLTSMGLERKQNDWNYPEDISGLVDRFRMKWVSYEELFRRIPEPPDPSLKLVYEAIAHFGEYFGLSPEDWYQGLLDAEASSGGVLAYTPLMNMLRDRPDDKGERKRVAAQHLPIALSCALQNDECLQDIKNVAETYLDLIPDILACALNLRKDKLFGEWTKYESKPYKDFIVSLDNKMSK